MLLLRAPLLRLSWPRFLTERCIPGLIRLNSPKKGFWDPDSLEKLFLRGICTASKTLNYLMGLSLKFRCSSVFAGGQPLIQEQGHPNQVLSVETRPICTPPASVHIHSPVPKPLLPRPPVGTLPVPLVLGSPVQLGLWMEG